MKKNFPPILLASCSFFVTYVTLLSAQRPPDYFVYIGSYATTTAKVPVLANQDTENVVVLRVDRATGRLSATGAQVPLANPGSIDFVKK